MHKNYECLPVYEQKNRILETLSKNQVIVVQSQTGSGKTTQLPVILHEAGYSERGIIAVTQPRRIAALSVSEFISKQLGTSYPGTVGYKMRFEDKTDATTRIKIMTDGILLQEMKLDPWLSKYSVAMVDEAHERSLNIDFVLGLLKRVLSERKDFKVIVSSATMNAEAFSNYFDGCPIVTIDTITYPVTVVYDPPSIPAGTATVSAEEALLLKITDTIDRVLDNHDTGDILCFLPGEKVIKDCMQKLSHAPFSRKIYLLPLYGRLAKEEQERVFANAPFGKKKVILSTNIAETSVTIPGITTVIDSGLAKLNFYNPHTYTSSLNETTVSKASCNQRKGRAGRTQPGTCYRLYSRKDFDKRPLYTTEEIYRTDLSEVVLRMAELGITDFEQFDFISEPGSQGIRGAIDTLTMLKALNSDRTLSPVGKLMVEFPLAPRQSRIIVEAIMHYPDVIDEVLIAAAFLSANSPFILPQGEESDARRAHHSFRDMRGDFVSYVKLFNSYSAVKNAEKFCENYYLDKRIMAEIVNIKEQLAQIIGNLGIPITGGGSPDDYLCCIASGMIQFVCVREGKENYRSLTAEHIQIHPGSNMFRADPLYIVAGEIVRTSRMFAMSVSPLTKTLLQKIDSGLESALFNVKNKHGSGKAKQYADASETRNCAKANEKIKNKAAAKQTDDSVVFGGTEFFIRKIKGKKHVMLPLDSLKAALSAERSESKLAQLGAMRGVVSVNKYTILSGEKLELIFSVVRAADLHPVPDKFWNKKLNVSFSETPQILIDALEAVLRVTVAKEKNKELGFIALFTDGKGNYWFKVSRGFTTALTESLSSLETLADESAGNVTDAQKKQINDAYRRLNGIFA
ncbi:MAG: ATP-dependent RNA helicase [Bacteroides sp.]|nr:ATP-dependent RNA helicase [Prevotella sp.]MCM1407258.1 ATP-dependent RNA helicase [Treponema brennaborense]MCM1469746.1 ATP-dependent RNA helicase [Bacteroides sp.]